MEESNTTTKIKNKAIRSVKWSVLMEIVSRAITPIVNVILARLLTPTDFGVVAIATAAISFSQVFWDAGLRQSLVQTDDAPEEAAHVVFWTNILLGIIIYGTIYFTAPSLAIFFDSPASGPVLRILGIQIILGSLSSVQQGLFVRDLDFRRLFWIKLLSAFVPGIFSILMAFSGYGVWALVTGVLVGQVINLVLLWYYSPWRPKFRYDLKLARKIYKFGAWAMIESVESWFITYGDNLLVGKFLNVGELGVYQMGRTLTVSLFTMALNPFIPVLYPTFSRLQNDLPALSANFHKVNRIVISLVLPIGVGFLLTGPEIAAVLFGNKWEGLGLVLSLFGLMWGFSWLVGINPDFYRAVGRPDINVKIFFIMALIYIPVYYFTVQFGLVVFLFVRLALVLVEISAQIFQFRSTMHDSPLYLWRDGKSFFLSALILGIALAVIKWGLYNLIPNISQAFVLAILVILGVIIYLAAIWQLDKGYFSQIARLIKRAA